MSVACSSRSESSRRKIRYEICSMESMGLFTPPAQRIFISCSTFWRRPEAKKLELLWPRRTTESLWVSGLRMGDLRFPSSVHDESTGRGTIAVRPRILDLAGGSELGLEVRPVYGTGY